MMVTNVGIIESNNNFTLSELQQKWRDAHLKKDLWESTVDSTNLPDEVKDKLNLFANKIPFLERPKLEIKNIHFIFSLHAQGIRVRTLYSGKKDQEYILDTFCTIDESGLISEAKGIFAKSAERRGTGQPIYDLELPLTYINAVWNEAKENLTHYKHQQDKILAKRISIEIKRGERPVKYQKGDVLSYGQLKDHMEKMTRKKPTLWSSTFSFDNSHDDVINKIKSDVCSSINLPVDEVELKKIDVYYLTCPEMISFNCYLGSEHGEHLYSLYCSLDSEGNTSAVKNIHLNEMQKSARRPLFLHETSLSLDMWNSMWIISRRSLQKCEKNKRLFDDLQRYSKYKNIDEIKKVIPKKKEEAKKIEKPVKISFSGNNLDKVPDLLKQAIEERASHMFRSDDDLIKWNLQSVTLIRQFPMDDTLGAFCLIAKVIDDFGIIQLIQQFHGIDHDNGITEYSVKMSSIVLGESAKIKYHKAEELEIPLELITPLIQSHEKGFQEITSNDGFLLRCLSEATHAFEELLAVNSEL
jgi:hypothetical protein